MTENEERHDEIVQRPEKEKRVRETAATRALVERLAKLEGMTPNQMRAKMAKFYEIAAHHLFDGGATPDVLNQFIIDYRMSVLEKGMEAVGAELRGEDRATRSPPVQHLGQRKFQMPGPDTIIRAEDDFSPQEPAPPTPAQRTVK